MALTTLHARLTVRALLRRRLPVTVLVLLPVALYLASHDTVGRSVRALVFGISWAISTRTVADVPATWARMRIGSAIWNSFD